MSDTDLALTDPPARSRYSRFNGNGPHEAFTRSLDDILKSEENCDARPRRFSGNHMLDPPRWKGNPMPSSLVGVPGLSLERFRDEAFRNV